MLKVRVELDLIDRWGDLRRFQSRFQMGLEIVRDSNRFHLARFLKFFHLCPRVLEVLVRLCKEGGMNQVSIWLTLVSADSNSIFSLIPQPEGRRAHIQVQVVQLHVLQGGIDSIGDIADVGDDLARHKELLPGDSRLLDRNAQLGFRPVNFGTVEVVVP